VKVTSVTGYYQSRMRNFDNFTNGYYAPTLGAAFFLLNIGETSEELRINTDFDGPVNFTAGVYFQSTAGEDSIRTAFNAVTPAASTQAVFLQNGTTYSGFGQARWQVISTVELAAGARYSHEHKEIPAADIGTGFGPLVPRIITPSNQASWSDTSPEATLTWRPTQTLTVFAAYKTGFLSGGFNTGSSSYQNIQYQPETIKGVEGGVKALLLEGALRTNLSLYHYKMDGLQVTVPVGPLNSIEELNAGGANINGVEFDVNYLTPIKGLKFTSGAAYNEANYTHYIASCYSSEPAPQCRILFNPTTGLSSLSQNLAGTQLVRAPLWTGNVGFDYERPVTIRRTSNLKLGLSSDMTFTSSYFTSADNRPAGIEPAYRLFDATLRLAESDDKWEIALIGRNLANKYYFDRSLGVSFTGGAAGAAAPVPADVAAVVSRGREMMLRGTWKFN
jgi:iron complex outermembrane receptor protein